MQEEAFRGADLLSAKEAAFGRSCLVAKTNTGNFVFPLFVISLIWRFDSAEREKRVRREERVRRERREREEKEREGERGESEERERREW